jgi:hypothetical protein
MINEVSVPVLLDTGATTTVVSLEAWKQFASPNDELEPSEEECRLTSASGDNLHILGSAMLTFQFGELEIPHMVDVLENLDHSYKHGCDIHYRTKTLEIAGRELPLHREEEQPRISRVTLARSVTIPPNSEMVLTGHLRSSVGLNEGSSGIIERKIGNQQFFTGRALVVPQKGKVPVRVANLTESPVRLKSHETLGWFHPSCSSDGKVYQFSEGEEGAQESTKVESVNTGRQEKTHLVGAINARKWTSSFRSYNWIKVN